MDIPDIIFEHFFPYEKNKLNFIPVLWTKPQFVFFFFFKSTIKCFLSTTFILNDKKISIMKYRRLLCCLHSHVVKDVHKREELCYSKIDQCVINNWTVRRDTEKSLSCWWLQSDGKGENTLKDKLMMFTCNRNCELVFERKKERKHMHDTSVCYKVNDNNNVPHDETLVALI